MYEYQVVSFDHVEHNTGAAITAIKPMPGLLSPIQQAQVHNELTQLVNLYVAAGWELDRVAMGGREMSSEALLFFRRALR
ncbi:MAG: hypothetical protein LBK28_05805 [Propionibacteriaceae bacterium]|jgi:hypothetical protein|nr:hypothetical protein [Propionibacteriaceae bacterium]